MRVVIIVLITLLINGCSFGPAGFLPELPRKDWLNPDKKSGENTAEKENLQIYNPNKTLNFEDLVFLAIQQSPVISRGGIDMEVQQIALTDTKWRYLPEVHLLYTISNNITQYNKGNPAYRNTDYGETAYQVQFSGNFQNPITTFFNVKAQNELLKVAQITHRKLIADVIEKLARSVLAIDLAEKKVKMLQELSANAEKKRDYSTRKEEYTVNLISPASLDEDYADNVDLLLREEKLQLAIEKSNLKMLVGLDKTQELNVNAQSLRNDLQTFKPNELSWRDVWNDTEQNFLMREQVQLEKANVMLAWARYTPNINFTVNDSPPKGQSQIRGTETDQFLHVYLSFPILDWGARYRQAKISGARERQRQLDLIEKEREYGQGWDAKEDSFLLAKARTERAIKNASSADKRLKAIEISYENGMADMALLSRFRDEALNRRITILERENAVDLARLAWMHYASKLAQRYLGNAGLTQDD